LPFSEHPCDAHQDGDSGCVDEVELGAVDDEVVAWARRLVESGPEQVAGGQVQLADEVQGLRVFLISPRLKWRRWVL
jgi:hypothetical protein